MYPVGPIVTQTSDSSKSGLLFDWLNKQPNDSMVYVLFGSGATLSHEQMNELAFGLELSKQSFVWVDSGDGFRNFSQGVS